jgi:hypothetical protein
MPYGSWGGTKEYNDLGEVQLDAGDQATLRELIAEYLVSCDHYLPACWYRVNSLENTHISLPSADGTTGETEALLPPFSNLICFGNKAVNNILTGGGLMSMDGWNDLKEKFSLEIDVEVVSHAELLGENVLVVRIGHYKKDEDPFDAVAQVKKIDAKTYTVSNKRCPEQRSFLGQVGRKMPVHFLLAMAEKDKRIGDDDDDDESDESSECEDKEDYIPHSALAATPVALAVARTTPTAAAATIAAASVPTISAASVPLTPCFADEEEEAAFRLILSLGQKHPKEFDMAAHALVHFPFPPKTMDVKPNEEETAPRKRKSAEASSRIISESKKSGQHATSKEPRAKKIK